MSVPPRSLPPSLTGHGCLYHRPRATVVAIAGTAARASPSPRKAASVLPKYATCELMQAATWHSQRMFQRKECLLLPPISERAARLTRKTSKDAVEVFTLNLGGPRDTHCPSLAQGTSTVWRPTLNSAMKNTKIALTLRNISTAKLKRK